jgi:hypothetical protein
MCLTSVIIEPSGLVQRFKVLHVPRRSEKVQIYQFEVVPEAIRYLERRILNTNSDSDGSAHKRRKVR